jgi:hypothetical protein
MSNLEDSAPPVWATWDVRSCRGPGGSSSRKVRGVQSGAKAQLDRSTAGEALAAKNRVISGVVKATRNRPSPVKPTKSDDEGSTHGSLEPRVKRQEPEGVQRPNTPWRWPPEDHSHAMWNTVGGGSGN